MACAAKLCFDLSVAAAKIHFEEQELVEGTKQSRRANKAGRLTSSWACLLCFVPATSIGSSK
jgi:hypothetical protein